MASVQTSSYDGRYLKLTVIEESYSIANNTSTVRWTLESIGGNTTYYTIFGCKAIVNGNVIHNSGTTNWDTYNFPAKKGSLSGTIVVGHDSDGTKSPISYSLTGAVYYNNPITYSGSLSLTPIPRHANILSAPNFNDENNPTITYSNPAGASVTSLQACISLTGSSDDIPYRNISNVGSEYTFNLTSAERNTLINSCVNSNSRDVIFYIRTVIGGNTFYSTLTRTLSIVNANPVFSDLNITYKDTNATVVSITNNDQHIVRNNSSLQANIVGATPKKLANIVRYEATFNGSTQIINSPGNVNYGVINIGANTTLSVKAIDSRGNYTIASKVVTILDWVNPSSVITLGRINNYEDIVKLKSQVFISSVNLKNTIVELKYRYKKTSDSGWGSYVNFSNNSETSVSLNKIYAWDFQIYVADKFGNTSYNLIIPKGMPIMFFDTNKISVGVNKFPTNNNSFDVDTINGKSILDLIYPVGSIYLSVLGTNPGTLFGGTWEKLENRFLLGAGTSYTAGTMGGASTVTLTANQIPAHNHSGSTNSTGAHSHGYESQKKRYADTVISGAGSILASNTAYNYATWYGTDTQGAHSHTVTINNTGGGEAHSNMPPYLAVYMWKRTA